MNVSAWSIRNPVPALLLFALLTLLGLQAFRNLGIQDFPDIELPTITISASLDGAAPSQLESQVARQIEDAVAGLAGVQHIRTTLTEGSARISVEFALEKPLSEALDDVRDAVNRVRADLPGDLREPVIGKVTTTGRPILTCSVASDRLDEEGLSWFVDDRVSRALLSVAGVGSVSRLGGVDREVLVELDAKRMDALGVTAAEVSSLIGRVHQESSGGRGDVGGQRQSIRTLALAGSAAEVAALELPLADGRRLRLDQVATVADGAAERSVITLLDGKPVVGFEVTRIKGASEVAVTAAVRAALVKLGADAPGVRIAEVFDTTGPVQESYEGSIHLLLEGGLLAVVVVWWFLRDWRATLVSATALPLSVIPTFLAMQMMGFTLNTLTLLALALVVGILVDDAIVEIENIVRHLRQGRTPFQAAMEAADEIGLAVIATTFTLVAVFLPTAFMGGIPGKFFRQFGWTAGVAVLASLLVARLLTPMMAAYLLKPISEPLREGRLMAGYLRLVRACLDHRWLTCAAAAGFFAASLALVPLLSTTFIPASDRGQTSIGVELPPGATLEQTRVLAERARVAAGTLPEVVKVFSLIGATTGGGMGATGATDVRKATLSVILTPRGTRARSQAQVESALRALLAPLPGARLGVGRGASGEKLELVLAGNDQQLLAATSQALQRDLRTIPGLGNITADTSLLRPEVQITPDPLRAAERGVTAAAIMQAVRVATVGDFDTGLAKLNLPQRQVPIRVRMAVPLRGDLDALGRLRIPATGGSVPLAAVATLAIGSGPAQVDRLDRQRRVSLAVELNGRQLGDVMRQAQNLPTLRALPPGITRSSGGDAERMAELFGNFGSAMLIGVLCIYIVLVLLFHDFLQPLTILAALPLSVGGALAALLLSGNTFSMPSVIGLLMLMGIVTKNSILLVDYAIIARGHGLARHDALVDACRKRAQPILMTTIAMGVGMLPIALGLSADPSFRSPMATVVIGGLITSTLLSLLVVPVVFTFVDDLAIRLLRRPTGGRTNQDENNRGMAEKR